MKKLLSIIAAVAILAISGQTLAAKAVDTAATKKGAYDKTVDAKIGKKIYDRAFGRGCGTCHDIASNPQLKKLIKSGKLKYPAFLKVIKSGRKAMPKAMAVIMKVKVVKKAKYSEDQAISAVYKYLSGKK